MQKNINKTNATYITAVRKFKAVIMKFAQALIPLSITVQHQNMFSNKEEINNMSQE